MSDDNLIILARMRGVKAVDDPAAEHDPSNPNAIAGWRPIESAPQDKDVLLGWWRTWPAREWECAAGLAGSTKGGWLHGQATHWMPLPGPPPA